MIAEMKALSARLRLQAARAWRTPRKTRHSMSLAVLASGLLTLLGALAHPLHAAGEGPTKFKRIAVQYIAALGDPGANSGDGAQSWGLWPIDPGPRGVWLDSYAQLQAAGGAAPEGWNFDNGNWWLEEHGLIMEQPRFPLPPGKYLVTGAREVSTTLTIHPADQAGNSRWELGDQATLHDVTHLACRSARYTPASVAARCTPAKVHKTSFPVSPGSLMPAVEGCNKQDYSVLFVIGVAVQN